MYIQNLEPGSYVCVYVYMCVCVCVYVCVYVYMCACACVYIGPRICECLDFREAQIYTLRERFVYLDPDSVAYVCLYIGPLNMCVCVYI